MEAETGMKTRIIVDCSTDVDPKHWLTVGDHSRPYDDLESLADNLESVFELEQAQAA